MTNHPNRPLRAAVIVEGRYAEIALPGGQRIETHALHEGRYIRINDGPTGQSPQLCYGASRRGATLVYYSAEHLARDCRARLYKTRAGFERAAAAL